ncbi:MAG: PilT/PilU family type 4a pilus ATPase, partial [Candidatus Riflebacteria bacterium]|nr:PilT/PilU family type 4a pilus ATPase [Candidatus Riflebacteria bacterium]
MSDNFFGKLFGGETPPGEDNKPKAPAGPPAQPPVRPPMPPSGTQAPPVRPVQPGAPGTMPTRPAAPAGHPAQPTAPSSQPAQPQARPPMPPAQAPAQRSTGIPASIGNQAGSLPPGPPRQGQAPTGNRASKTEDDDGEVIIDDLLRLIVEKSGSDLHLTVGSPPMLRLQGKLWPTDVPSLTAKETRRLIYQFLNNDQRERLERDLELDISYELESVARFRCNIFFTRLGMGGVFRVIPTRIKTLAELKLPAILGDLARRNKGLILVTGPTGSGKSTTLAAMVDQVNHERQDHILTIEDPIEFVHQHKSCLVNQREIGPNTKSFSAALRSALREDPDIILVGEMRDYETISLAVTAAETGH